MADDTMPVEVHGLIAQSFSKEYVEAVVQDAVKILPSYQHRQDTLVVVNPRRLAVILDKQARRGAVIPVELVEEVVKGPGEPRAVEAGIGGRRPQPGRLRRAGHGEAEGAQGPGVRAEEGDRGERRREPGDVR